MEIKMVFPSNGERCFQNIRFLLMTVLVNTRLPQFIIVTITVKLYFCVARISDDSFDIFWIISHVLVLFCTYICRHTALWLSSAGLSGVWSWKSQWRADVGSSADGSDLWNRDSHRFSGRCGSNPFHVSLLSDVVSPSVWRETVCLTEFLSSGSFSCVICSWIWPVLYRHCWGRPTGDHASNTTTGERQNTSAV